jgi:hypothetical protein
VYHVDGTQAVGMDRIFTALRGIGLRLEPSTHPDFLSLFSAARDTKDADLALGYFWATRKPRNVRFNHERTHRTLQRLGHAFRPLDDAWLSRFVKGLAEAGVFAGSGPRPPHATAPCAERLASD